MRRARFSEEQILEILRAGEKAEDLPAFYAARNITLRTYRTWLASHGASLAGPNGGQLPSRSQRTREVRAINQLGVKLVALSPLKLERLELPDDLHSAIVEYRGLTKGARGRQKRLVCKILRSEDHEAIRKQLESIQLDAGR
jgi:ribosomal 50S subunit-associated protein YjgA (DUF615 family)